MFDAADGAGECSRMNTYFQNTKARTINKILGKDYIVKASVGHVKDLPQKTLGVDVENDFKSEYGVIPGKEKVTPFKCGSLVNCNINCMLNRPILVSPRAKKF